jgi:phosphoribosyl 1,2-cyclic phosphate phosphodiesterase
VFGFRIKDFIYLTDLSFISEKEKNKMFNAEVIILDSLRKEPHMSHLCLQESIDLLKELKPRKAYLTHISHLMGLNSKVNKELPGFIQLAYDGQIINL